MNTSRYQKRLASLVNMANFNTDPFCPSTPWQRKVHISVYRDRIELRTLHAITALPSHQWRLELEPSIPNRVTLRHIPTNTPTFFRVNPWITRRFLAELEPQNPPQLLPPPPTTAFILITPRIFH